MTTKKSQARGLKSWVFGYATLHGNGVSLDLKKSKGLLGSAVLQKCQSLFAAWPTQEKYKCWRCRDSCRKQTTLQ